jgi:hypothetical protein
MQPAALGAVAARGPGAQEKTVDGARAFFHRIGTRIHQKIRLKARGELEDKDDALGI